MGISDRLTCLLRNLYAGQEATVRTGHGTMDQFHIGKGVHQGCTLSPCLFNLYVEYVMRNARLDEAQAGIKIVERNINNPRYADELLSFMVKRPCLRREEAIWLDLTKSAWYTRGRWQVFTKKQNKKITTHCFHCFPIYLPWSAGTGCHGLSFLNVEF